MAAISPGTEWILIFIYSLERLVALGWDCKDPPRRSERKLALGPASDLFLLFIQKGEKQCKAVQTTAKRARRLADAGIYEKQSLPQAVVRLTLSDMKMLTVRDLNRKTASVLDAVERGETFELRRHGRAVGYITRTAPSHQRKPDWKTHFDWLRKQATKNDSGILSEFEQERRRQAAREKELGNLK
jgi:antitoxin (DNA-binding transcriptional repressor) of toxin-antitoxin stability system